MPVRLVHSAPELAALLDINAPAEQIWPDFCPFRWFDDPDHIALRIGLDLSMFEDEGDGEWLGHIWFETRGALALERARAMLDHMFTRYSAKRIRGEIPKHRRDVLAFVHRLGFRRIGLTEQCGVQYVVVGMRGALNNLRPMHSMP